MIEDEADLRRCINTLQEDYLKELSLALLGGKNAECLEAMNIILELLEQFLVDVNKIARTK